MTSRRNFLTGCALISGGIALGGCEHVISGISQRLGDKVPPVIELPPLSEKIDSHFHLLSRATYGAWPGELARIKSMGAKAWLEEQLNPERIDDKACELRARRFESLEIDAGTAYEFRREAIRRDLVRHAILMAVYSRRQLQEVMVEFWSDHFNISVEKGDCIYLKPSDEKAVVRANALGKFRQLVRHSALSPAMLVYLDGKDNKKEKAADKPNENYARELLELHTMGVGGGYSQKDVFEVARCLTGWRLHDRQGRGTAYFDKQLHDDGEKIVLGKLIAAGGGEKDLDSVLDIVLAHPSTAKYLATKFVRHFVNEDPPPSLVEKLAKLFRDTEGDTKAILAAIFFSDEFKASAGQKFKRPFRYIVGALRNLAADTHAHSELTEYLSRMGHAPFQYPTPDGYPEESQPWMGTLLWRWNYALALSSAGIEGVHIDPAKLVEALWNGQESQDIKNTKANIPVEEKVDEGRLFAYLVGRAPLNGELAVFKKYFAATGSDSKKKTELIGLIMASPAYQMY